MKLACPLHGTAQPRAARGPVRYAAGLSYCPACTLEFQTDYQPPTYDATYYAAPDYAGLHRREDQRKAAQLWTLLPPGPAGRLLEIGPGLGCLLRLAHAAGWRTEAVEPVAALHAQLPPATVVHAVPFEQAQPDPGFNLIVMADVIEHFPEPRTALMRAAALATPGGRLLIETPNRGSIYARMAGNCWAGYSPFHAFFYTAPQLTALLAATGWRVATVATSPLDLCSLDGFWRSGLQERQIGRAHV